MKPWKVLLVMVVSIVMIWIGVSILIQGAIDEAWPSVKHFLQANGVKGLD